MRLFAAAALATGLLLGCVAQAQVSEAQTPIPDIRVDSVGLGYPGTLMRDPSFERDQIDWWGPADYPATAFVARQTGNVTLDLTINADGELVECRPEVEEGAVAFADAACAIVARGRFVHALTVDGKPAAGRMNAFVSFELRFPGGPPRAPVQVYDPGPQSEPTPIDQDPFTIRGVSPGIFPVREISVGASVRADGSVGHCFIYTSAGTDAGDIAVCRHVLGLRFKPSVNGFPNTYFSIVVEP